MRTQGRVEEPMTCSQKVDLPLPGAPTNITTICFPFVPSPFNKQNEYQLKEFKEKV